MTDVSNIHNNVVKLQVVSKEAANVVSNRKAISANDSQYKDNARISMGYTLPESAIKLRDQIMSLRLFVKELVHEYASTNYCQDEFRVKFSDLSFEDQQIFLSHLTIPSEYEEYCSKPTLLRAGILEYRDYMQRMLNEASQEVYSEYLSEMHYNGMYAEEDF